MKKQTNGPVIIIGAGFAGLAAGIYARMNGYESHIIEMHDKPGGLCTSWKRKGYTIDGCIHWLVGSSAQSGLHDFWEEVGIAQGRDFINLDEYARIEGPDGRSAVLYCDTDRLEKSLLDFSPADEKPIREFTEGVRMVMGIDQPSKHDNPVKRVKKQMKNMHLFLTKGKVMQKWMKTRSGDFADRFTDPLLQSAFRGLWGPDFSMLFILFTFGYLHNKNAGYPIGGSMPMSEAIEKRYRELGGVISYGRKVEKIIVEGNRATGVILSGGEEMHGSRVISAADGYNTIYKMLDNRYTDDKIKERYDTWKPFFPLIYAGIGVNRTFRDLPQTVSGMSLQLAEKIEIGDQPRDRIWFHVYNHDPTLAPEGKTVIIFMMETSYEYWKNLYEDREAYKKKKEEVGTQLIAMLERRFPGISDQVEMTDIATPMTFERYTGNWKGSFEGWLLTPENANVVMKPLEQTLPGLDRFYMCGQWVEPGGGLPTAIMSARRLFKSICREDGKKFRT